MNFLQEIQSKRGKLKCTETIVTKESGRKYIETNSGLIELNEKSYGFIIDTKPDLIPACILDDGLYLGSQDSVTIENLKTYSIKHVLSIGIPSPISNITNVEITNNFLPCLDLPETNLENILTKSNQLITNALNNNEKILVHCNAGVSRSSTVIIAFLITERQMTFKDAFDLVKSKREVIQPNAGFLHQLKMLEIK